jgi:hypothetical protein
MRATATFEITGWDQTEWDDSPSGKLGRAHVTKQFSGDLVGTSAAEVLTAGTSAGPAAYTAQERFTGSLGDRTGSFIAQHGATSIADGSRWVIVAGSGSDGLVGLTGTALLEVTAEGVHQIVFDYDFDIVQ